jgi:glycosyltransferase involved in cell wall biosynthesis
MGSISVIIPAYNDAGPVGTCLQALFDQTVLPDEVIVVDNNSTDDIESVVASFPGVTLLRESRQGNLFARSTGFDQASGNILARLDADSIPSPTWIEEIGRSFTFAPVAAVSGPLYFHDIVPVLQPLSRAGYSLVHRGVKRQFLAGANMALRREVWWRTRDDLCQEALLHEDIDIALHLHAAGQVIAHNPQMVVGTSARRMDDTPTDYSRYIRRWIQTYRWHQRSPRRIILPSLFLLSGYPVVKLIRVLQVISVSYRPRSEASLPRINQNK